MGKEQVERYKQSKESKIDRERKNRNECFCKIVETKWIYLSAEDRWALVSGW